MDLLTSIDLCAGQMFKRSSCMRCDGQGVFENGFHTNNNSANLTGKNFANFCEHKSQNTAPNEQNIGQTHSNFSASQSVSQPIYLLQKWRRRSFTAINKYFGKNKHIVNNFFFIFFASHHFLCLLKIFRRLIAITELHCKYLKKAYAQYRRSRSRTNWYEIIYTYLRLNNSLTNKCFMGNCLNIWCEVSSQELYRYHS